MATPHLKAPIPTKPLQRAFGLSTSRVSRGTAPEYFLHDDGSGNISIQAVYDPQLIPIDLDLGIHR